jgi:hypothetical protein
VEGPAVALPYAGRPGTGSGTRGVPPGSPSAGRSDTAGDAITHARNVGTVAGLAGRDTPSVGRALARDGVPDRA